MFPSYVEITVNIWV